MEVGFFVTEVTNLTIMSLQGTPLLNKGIDLGVIKNLLLPTITTTVARLDKASLEKVLGFIKDRPLIKECIVPNMVQIMSDGRLALDDIPALLNIIVGIYTDVNQMFQTGQSVTLSTNDLIEVVGLLLKVVFAVVLNDQTQMKMAMSLVDSAVAMVKLSMSPKKCSFALKCCC